MTLGIELYYILIFFFFSACFFSLQKTKKNNLIENYFFNFLFLFLFILSAFKDISVGTDTIHYFYIYEWVSFNQFSGRYEILFFYYVKLIQLIFDNFYNFIILSYLIIFINLYIFIKKMSLNRVLTLSIFFLIFFFPFNTMIRQAIAISFFMLAYSYLFNNNYKKYFLFSLIAIGFHYSAILVLLFPLIKKLKLNFKYFIIVFLILFLIYFNNVLLLVSDFSGLYIKYLYDEGAGGLYALGQAILGLFFILLYVVINRKLIKYYNQSVKNYEFNIWMILFFILCSIATIEIPVMARLTYYFAVPFVLILSNNINEFRDTLFSLSYTVIIFLVFVIYQTVIFIYRPKWDGFFPYKFILDY